MKLWWDRVGVQEGEAIENRMLSRVIEGAQKKVEARNFDIRKHLLDYDDVMNKQRQAFYARRLARHVARRATGSRRDRRLHRRLRRGAARSALAPARRAGERRLRRDGRTPSKPSSVSRSRSKSRPSARPANDRHRDRDALGHAILERFGEVLEAKREEGRVLKHETYAAFANYPGFDDIARDLQLQILDSQWKGHLRTMDGLRESINLRGYAQRDPKIEYQREGFALFGEMEQRIDDSFAGFVFRFGYPRPAVAPPQPARHVEPARTAALASSAAIPGTRCGRGTGCFGPALGASSGRRRRTGLGRLPIVVGGGRALESGGGREGRTQRSLSLWQRQEAQEMLRRVSDRSGESRLSLGSRRSWGV